MKFAVFSDVHANAPALRAVLADAAAQGAERYICLGDVVGYGPLPTETLGLVRETAAITLAGNHDDAVSGRLDPENFIDLAGDAVVRHREELPAADLKWLKALPYTCTFGEAIAAHGDLTDPESFLYTEGEDAVRANFAATDRPLVFVGHTHLPCIHLTGQSGAVYRLEPQGFTLEEGKRYIVNPGSVGYPREANGECHSSYVLYDADERTVEFRFLPFSVASVMQRGRNSRPSKKLLARILSVVAIALSAALAFLLLRDPPAADPRTPPVAVREIELQGRGRTAVCANLKLDRNRSPAIITIRFKNTAGEILSMLKPEVVRQAHSRTVKAPEGAAAAEFTVSKINPEDTPEIISFVPSETSAR